MKKLVRSRTDKYVAGVAGGLAEYLGIDANLVRIVLVALSLFTPIGIGSYAVLWLVLPAGEGGPTGFESLRRQFGRSLGS